MKNNSQFFPSNIFQKIFEKWKFYCVQIAWIHRSQNEIFFGKSIITEKIFFLESLIINRNGGECNSNNTVED